MRVLIALLFLALIAGAAFRGLLPMAAAGAYAIASVATLLTYAADKSAAETGRWRTSEMTLHLLALAGGWPGALIAQQQFHHKSRKLPFQIAFWATVALNCAALVWYWRTWR